MTKKNGKELYEPPRAINLSGLGVSGQVQPQGICSDGSALTFETCADGPTPTGGVCSPNGISPEYGYCQPTGGLAVEGCWSGGVHI